MSEMTVEEKLAMALERNRELEAESKVLTESSLLAYDRLLDRAFALRSERDRYKATLEAIVDDLDKRTRPEGTPEIRIDDDTHASTIPGCYCRECKYYREDDEIEGLGWCECPHPVANATGFASREYGCVFGERQEAE